MEWVRGAKGPSFFLMSARVKIDFMVAGFSKCGTTSLCAALAQHPDIFIPDVKEPRYFSSYKYENNPAGYEKMYAPARPGQKLGDGSPVYSAASHADIAVPRILENNPHCRFIFIARHPRKRIESFYREMHHSGAHFGVRPPFDMHSFLQQHPDAIENVTFIDRIQKFIDTFGADSVLPVFLEDFRADGETVTKRCCDHIGVDPGKLPPIESTVLNVGEDKLYDTRLLRWLRKNPRFRFAMSQMPPERQNVFFRRLRLRLPFRDKPIPWDNWSEQLYQDTIVPQSRKYLELCNKPTNFWKL